MLVASAISSWTTVVPGMAPLPAALCGFLAPSSMESDKADQYNIRHRKIAHALPRMLLSSAIFSWTAVVPGMAPLPAATVGSVTSI